MADSDNRAAIQKRVELVLTGRKTDCISRETAAAFGKNASADFASAEFSNMYIRV